MRHFLSMASGFWRGPGTSAAWLLSACVLILLLAQIASQVAVNAWGRKFFDALEKKDLVAVSSAVSWLPLIIVAALLCLSGLAVLRLLLQMRWREWMTNRIAGWWIADQRYYRLAFTAPDQTAPEYRIAEDVRLAIEPLTDFALGIITAVITAATFATILWKVAGSANIAIGAFSIDVPAYMAVAAVAYAVAASLAAYVAGSPLVRKVAAKNEAEAQFRAEMTRLRENAESIALIRGDRDELSSVRETYGAVVQAWVRIIRQQGVIALVLNTNGALFPIIPLLLVTPKYLNGELTLGAVMQVVAAFSAVQGALIWFVDNFVRLAEWYASVERVRELTEALEALDSGILMEDEARIDLGLSEDGAIHIENLSVAEKGGRVVINDASVMIAPGEKVMVAGESGAGKSVLIRALAGLWPWGSGSIRVPRDVTIAFVPQRPYLPLGTLRNALLYPAGDAAVSDLVIAQAMKRCGLGYFIKRLDDDARWDQTLSGGERQRVAFCRLLIQKPQIIVMDEATSALDEEAQTSLLSLLREELVGATVISVAHRQGVEAFHDRRITLEKRHAGSELTSRHLPQGLWRLLPAALKP